MYSGLVDRVYPENIILCGIIVRERKAYFPERWNRTHRLPERKI